MKRINRFKKAKFFCEFCGKEVHQNDKVCQYCGKFFASVRCPRCGKVGRTDEFTHGCPACGYAVRPSSGKKSSFGLRNLLGLGASKGGASKNYDGSLPVWMYIVVIAVLAALCAGLYSCLT
ncbi:MAG: zinc ribbon domain-containing protein [Treponema sp.]|nr:zinc ribbon domain-containing protein [Treponema sp.]